MRALMLLLLLHLFYFLLFAFRTHFILNENFKSKLRPLRSLNFDCCSSRILLLKEETLKLIREKQHEAYFPGSLNSSALAKNHTHSRHGELMPNNTREFKKTLCCRPYENLSKKHNQSSVRGEPRDGNSGEGNANSGEGNANSGEGNANSRGDGDSNSDVATNDAAPQSAIEKTSLVRNNRTGDVNLFAHHTTYNPESAGGDTASEDHVVESPSVAASNDFITDPAVREKYAGNPRYHTIDLYYAIMRDVLTYECLGDFLTDFCLNRGRCFRYPIANHSFYSCECADGYVGERCESKLMVNELYMPSSLVLAKSASMSSQPKILMARIVFTYPTLIFLSAIYILVAAVLVIQRPRQRVLADRMRTPISASV